MGMPGAAGSGRPSSKNTPQDLKTVAHVFVNKRKYGNERGGGGLSHRDTRHGTLKKQPGLDKTNSAPHKKKMSCLQANYLPVLFSRIYTCDAKRDIHTWSTWKKDVCPGSQPVGPGGTMTSIGAMDPTRAGAGTRCASITSRMSPSSPLVKMKPTFPTTRGRSCGEAGGRVGARQEDKCHDEKKEIAMMGKKEKALVAPAQSGSKTWHDMT